MRLTLILALSTLTAGALAAEKPAEIPPQQKEIEKMNAEYVAAFGRADDKALAAFYTEDADQTDGEGNEVLSGRAAIEKQLKDYFAANKDAVIELHTDSVRLLAAEVVLEKGEAEVTQADGVGTRSNYVAVHVKREGKWLIAHLTEVVSQDAPTPYSHLQELEWMVGTWKDNTSEAEVYTTCQWAANRTYLTRSFSAKSTDRGPLEGTEVIGWDPIKACIHSWTFDSEGGFSEGIWSREGNRWLIQSVTTLPDGRKASAHNTITYASDHQYTWESSNRVFDGEVRPNIDKIAIERVKASD
jgi:uncharacterized protein (TIGR02246 family)